jgi:transcriptional regulator with XRE-family HTH domain
MHRQGLTLDTLARRSGLAIATIAALRAGTRGKRPRPATLQRLAHGLGLPEQDVATAANTLQPLTQTAREAALLNIFRQLRPSDQLLAERIMREIARTTANVDALEGE